MSRTLRPAAALAFLLLLVGSCSKGGGASGGVSLASLINMGLVSRASELAADGDLVLIGAREFQAGGRDLNQDGDAFDVVAFVLDLATGVAQNTALALDTSSPTRLAQARGNLALLPVSETQSAGRDLNGDGDSNDVVVYVHDRLTHLTRGLGLALSTAPGMAPALGGSLAAFAVSEAGQRQDLNGDGRRDADVLFVYDAATGALENTGMTTPSRLFLEQGSVAYFANERGGDRNGDGDALDLFVLQVFDLATRMNHDSRLATDGADPVFAGGAWLVGVPEPAQGRDLDGDGARTSVVAHVFVPGIDPVMDEVRNLGLACVDFPCALAGPADGAATLFALRVAETDEVDLNLDGDFLDLVPHLYDPGRNLLFGTGVASFAPPVFGGGVLGFLADEAGQGADLDGDGDLFDSVAFQADLLTGEARSLAQEAIDLRGSPDFLLLARREVAAGIDWNGDGDRADVVVHVFDPRKDRTTNTRVASADVFGATASEILLYSDETAQSIDLNTDGDLFDQVFVLFSLTEDRARSTGLAGGPGGERFGRLGPGGGVLLLVNELAQGRDLDGDGDQRDDVVHHRR